MKSPYAEQYRILKKSFELDKEEFSQIEAVEAVAVKFAGILDRANVIIEKLSMRTVALETENLQLKSKLDESEKRIADLESRLKSFDDDLNKVFNWMNKVDEDLYNEISISRTAIAAKLIKLDQQVNNWYNGLNVRIDRIGSAVDTNSRNIQTLWNSIRR